MKFSITIPAYKTRFLRECIDSVLAQTYTDFEVIILNDASPEDVDGIVHSFTDNRIRYYKNEQNVGAVNLVDNWNKCLELAKGDYIICMGDDDRLMPDCLELYSKLIVQYPSVDLFHTRTFRIDARGTIIGVSHAYAEYERVFSFMLHRQCYGIQFIGDFCYRTSFLKELGGYFPMPFAWGTDDITAYLAAADHGIVNIGKPTFCYRTHGQSITTKGHSSQKLLAVKKEQKWYRKFLSEQLPQDVIEEQCRDEIQMRMDTYFIKKKAMLMAIGLRSSKAFLVDWICHRRNYGLSIKSILLAFYYYKQTTSK